MACTWHVLPCLAGISQTHALHGLAAPFSPQLTLSCAADLLRCATSICSRTLPALAGCLCQSSRSMPGLPLPLRACTQQNATRAGIFGVFTTPDLPSAAVLSSFSYSFWNLFAGFVVRPACMASLSRFSTLKPCQSMAELAWGALQCAPHKDTRQDVLTPHVAQVPWATIPWWTRSVSGHTGSPLSAIAGTPPLKAVIAVFVSACA